jgi:cell division protein FtsB
MKKRKKNTEKTVVRRVTVDRMDRGGGDDDDAAQKAKLIFLSLVALVVVLLLTSFIYAGKARSARNAALQELEACKQDNAKLTQWLEERTQEVEKLKKQGQKKPPAKAKTPAKKKTSSKKPARTGKNR